MSEQPTPTIKTQSKLRGEILKCIKLRQQIIPVTLTLAGVVTPTMR